jgi:hypothetical protein
MDYERLGRQIALPELGPEGQARLSAAAVRFVGHPSAVEHATRCWKNAGGSIADDTDPRALVVPVADAVGSECEALGLGAWAALRALRTTLGWGPTDTPDALVAALDSTNSLTSKGPR